MKSSKYPFNKIANLLLLFFISSICSAEYLHNMSIKKIIDGDTVHVFHQGEVYKVRLIEIDAPKQINHQNFVFSLRSN